MVFTFNNDNTIRVVDIDGDPWFLAQDVCRAIGVAVDKRSGNVVFAPSRFTTLDSDEVRLHPMQVNLADGRVQMRQMYHLSESGLYKLILRSDKPEAKDFQNWVTKVVLPAIRKDGGYIAGEEKPRTFSRKICDGNSYVLKTHLPPVGAGVVGRLPYTAPMASQPVHIPVHRRGKSVHAEAPEAK